jgi:O-antigen/teichoic acid export membrane protein
MSIRRNTAYNLLGSVIPLAVSLVTIPIYLNLIGESRYGVLAIAWLLLGYFGLFDLGLGRATAQRIAALRDASGAERAETFWTALAMNLCLGVFGALLMWPVAGYFFGQVFKIDDALRPEMLAAIPWLMLAVSRKRALTPFAVGLQKCLNRRTRHVLGSTGTGSPGFRCRKTWSVPEIRRKRKDK